MKQNLPDAISLSSLKLNRKPQISLTSLLLDIVRRSSAFIFGLSLMRFLTDATMAVGWGVVAGLSEKSHEYNTLSTVVPCSL